MQTFADKNSYEWSIEFNVGIIEVIKDRLNVDLIDPTGDDGRVLVSVSPTSLENIKTFCNMLFLLCEEQCEKKEITSAQFGTLLAGESLKHAYEAFFNEWQFFFQSLGRMDLVEAISKMQEILKENVKDLMERIKAVTMDQVREQTLNGLTGSEE